MLWLCDQLGRVTSAVVTDRCGNQNGAFSWSELAQGLLTVSLRTITMDTGTSIPLSIQEVLQGISPFLGLHKNQSQWVLPYRTENIQLMVNMTSAKKLCLCWHLYICSQDYAKTNNFSFFSSFFTSGSWINLAPINLEAIQTKIWLICFFL